MIDFSQTTTDGIAVGLCVLAFLICLGLVAIVPVARQKLIKFARHRDRKAAGAFPKRQMGFRDGPVGT